MIAVNYSNICAVNKIATCIYKYHNNMRTNANIAKQNLAKKQHKQIKKNLFIHGIHNTK